MWEKLGSLRSSNFFIFNVFKLLFSNIFLVFALGTLSKGQGWSTFCPLHFSSCYSLLTAIPRSLFISLYFHALVLGSFCLHNCIYFFFPPTLYVKLPLFVPLYVLLLNIIIFWFWLTSSLKFPFVTSFKFNEILRSN